MTTQSAVRPANFSQSHKLRLAYFVSHPIQYQAPLLRRIAQEPDIDLQVFFSSDLSVRGYLDEGFGVQVKWDIPLLDGYNYEFLPRTRDSERLTFSRPLNWGIWKRLRRGKFHAVWVHGYSTLNSLQAIFAARQLGFPVLIRSDSTLFDRPRSAIKLAAKKIFFRSIKSAVSAVLSVGQSNSEYWRHHLGGEVPIFLLPYAVDNEFFENAARQASSRREEIRSQLDLEVGRPVVLFASKLQTRKRCVDLVDAFVLLSKSGKLKAKPYLILVGDGEERGALEIRAKAANSGDIRFLGFQNQRELPRFFDLCDVFVLPSVNEPWGLVINEVMNASRAVIVSDQVGCQKDLVRHGENGFVFPARDVDALAEGLLTILDRPETAAEMGRKSLEIVQDFGFDRNISGLREALQRIVPGFEAITPEHR